MPIGLYEVDAPRISIQLAHAGGKVVSPMHQHSVLLIVISGVCV
jgi:hypothetical protein